MSWWKFFRPKQKPKPTGGDLGPKPIETLMEQVDATPDRPIPFGYKMSWLAVRSSDSGSVCDALEIDNLQPANWKAGYIAAYNGHSFISPPVNGWVLLVGHELPELGHPPHERRWTSLMASLSKKFGVAQYFATHRVSGLDAWACYQGGHEVRAFAYCDEVLVNRGEVTAGELELDYDYLDPSFSVEVSELERGVPNTFVPDEEHTMEVAGRWSVNPQSLDQLDTQPGVGWIGNLGWKSKSER